MGGVKTDYDQTLINSITYVIPKSLAESRFGLLYLSSLFQNMFELLSLKVMFNVTSHGHTLLPNATIAECFEADDTKLAIQNNSFNSSKYNTCSMEKDVFLGVLRVLLAFWGVKKGVTKQALTLADWTKDAKTMCAFLMEVFDDEPLVNDWVEDFNNNNGETDKTYKMKKEWVKNPDNIEMPADTPDYSSPKHTLVKSDAELLIKKFINA